MSFLDKLVRNDQALDVRPEAALGALLGGRKKREREAAEQQDNGAADRLANVALTGNPADTAAKNIVADNEEQSGGGGGGPNVGKILGAVVGGKLGKVISTGGVDANVGGFNVHIDAKPGLDGKHPKLPLHVEADGLGGAVKAEADIDPLAKDKKLHAKVGADVNVGGVELKGDVESDDLLAKEKHINANASANAKVAGIDLAGEVHGTDVTSKKNRKITAKGTADAKLGPADLHGEINRNENGKITAKGTADAKVAGATLHGDVNRNENGKISANGTADATVAGVKVHGDVHRSEAGKISANGTADANVAGVKVHGDVHRSEEGKVSANGTADANVAGVALHGDVHRNENGQVTANGTADANVAGVALHGDVHRDEAGKISANGTADYENGPAKAHGEIHRDGDGKVTASANVDYEKGPLTAHGEINRDADGKVDAKGNVDYKNGPVSGHLDASRDKDGKVDAHASADYKQGPKSAHAEINGENLTNDNRKVDAKATADYKNGPLTAHAEATGENLTNDNRKVGFDASADVKAGKVASGHIEAKSEDLTKDSRVHAEASGHIGKKEGKVETDNLFGPVERFANAAIGAVENVFGGGKSAHDAPASASAPAAASASAVTASPAPALGAGGKKIAARGVRHSKNAVGRWGANLDSLDIGAEPDVMRPMAGPGAEVASADGGVEVAVPGVTLPKMTPRGPRPKAKPRLGHGDWHGPHAQHAQHAKGSIGARSNEASEHGEDTAGAASGMMSSALSHDQQTGSALSAKAARPPTLVSKRGGSRKPVVDVKHEAIQQPSAAQKQAHGEEAAQLKTPAGVAGTLEQIGAGIDSLATMAKEAVEGFLDPLGLVAKKAETNEGGLNGVELVNAVTDPKTRARAATKGVPGPLKNGVLGRLDAVSAVGLEKAQQFIDHLGGKTEEQAAGNSNNAEAVTAKGGRLTAAHEAMHAGGDALAGAHDVSESYLVADQRDRGALRRIRDEALGEIGPVARPTPVTADQAAQQAQNPQQAMQQQPAHVGRDPHQIAAHASQQANAVGAQQGARSAQHAQHARHRENEAQQRAAARKKQADNEAKQQAAQAHAAAQQQREKMKAELSAHKDVALEALTLNKEQLAAKYNERLTTDSAAIRTEITTAQTQVRETWDKQKPLAQQACTQAIADIGKFCDHEHKQIDAQLKTLEHQLKTNKEQAAKTAEQQGKDDCERYAHTRDTNIDAIHKSAEGAASEQRKLGAEAERIALARAERATDDEGKKKAQSDAAAQKSHFEQLANQCIADGNTKATQEKTKYDDLIAKRTASYKTTAQNIREKGVGYLDELKKSFEQAKKDIDTLRVESIAQAQERLKNDLLHIQLMVDQEMQRLELQLQDRINQIKQEIQYALASMANLTEAQKAKMRADIERAHNEACARIDQAKDDELNACALQLQDCHSRIDAALGAIGSHTVKAVRALSSFKQDFTEQVHSTSDMIKDRCEKAVTAQQQIAATVQTTAATIRSGAMDSVSGKSAEELKKRDVWSDWSKSKDEFAKLQKADTEAAVKRQADIGSMGDANRERATTAKLDSSKRAILDATGGWGINPDVGAVMRELAKLSPEEVQRLMNDPDIKKQLEGLATPSWWGKPPSMAPGDLQRLNDLGKSGTPEQMKAKILDWSFNGGFTGIGYDDTTFKEVMKGLSPEERREIDKNYKQQTGKTLDSEINDEAWWSGQNNRLMHANLKSDAAAIAEEKWQAAEGGFFRGVKDFVDSVPGGRVLADPGGELMRSIGPMFGFKAPDSPLDQLAGFGMNQDAYIKQTDRIRELTEPPPGASAAQVSEYLQKRRDMMREIDEWLGANHQGLTLEKMDNSEASSEYNKFWMKGGDNTTFRNMLDAGRTGDWAKYSNNKAAYGVETTLGNRNWLKEEIDHRTERGDMKGLRDFLGQRSQDGKFETFIDENIPQKVDRAYFKSIGEDPPPEKGSQRWKEMMANKLLYAQFGGRTGWGDDREEMAKIIGGLSKEELDQIRGEYKKLSGEYGLSSTENNVMAATNPAFFLFGNWSAGDLDKDVYLSNSGYMHDLSLGVIGKGREYALMEYDLQHGKPQTLQDMMAREKFQRDFDTSSGLLNKLREMGVYDARGVQGKLADEKYNQMVALYEKLQAAGVSDMRLDDPRIASLSPDTLRDLALFHQTKESSDAWAVSANQQARSLVDGAVTVVTTAATIITTVAITIVTAGTATPFIVAALAAAGGAAVTGLAGMGVKVAMLGNAYGGGEAKMDFANLVIDSIVAGVTAGTGIEKFAHNIVGKLGIEHKLAQTLMKELIQNAVTSGADLTKFLLDENLYKGSPEEVLARIRQKSLQLGGTAIVSTGLGATKFNNSITQAAVQSAMTYDPSQPLQAQFLGFLQAAGTNYASEYATKVGEHISNKRYGDGGFFDPDRKMQETALPGNGARVRADGTIEVSSPEIASYLREQVAAGNAKVLDGEPPRIKIKTADGFREVVLGDGIEAAQRKQRETTPDVTPEDARKESVAARERDWQDRMTPEDRAAIAEWRAKRDAGEPVSEAPPLPQFQRMQMREDAPLERIAHGAVYEDKLSPEDARYLQQHGLKVGERFEGAGGLQMMTFVPIDGSGAQPVLAIRGTTPKEPADLLDDIRPQGVGTYQLSANEGQIAKALASLQQYGKPVITGHSLGGSLSQMVAAEFPTMVGRVVTFQPAAIPKEMVAKLDLYNYQARKEGRAEVLTNHYVVEGDLVSTAGQGFTDGNLTTLNRNNSWNALGQHLAHPLQEFVESGEGGVVDARASSQKTNGQPTATTLGPDRTGLGSVQATVNETVRAGAGEVVDFLSAARNGGFAPKKEYVDTWMEVRKAVDRGDFEHAKHLIDGAPIEPAEKARMRQNVGDIVSAELSARPEQRGKPGASAEVSAPDPLATDPTRVQRDLPTIDHNAINSRLQEQGFVKIGGGNGEIMFATSLNEDQMTNLSNGRTGATEVSNVARAAHTTREADARYLVFGRMPAAEVGMAKDAAAGGIDRPGFNTGTALDGVQLRNASMIIDIKSPAFAKIEKGLQVEQYLAQLGYEAHASKGASPDALYNGPKHYNYEKYTNDPAYLESYAAYKRMVTGEAYTPERAKADIQARINRNYDASGRAVGDTSAMWNYNVVARGQAERDGDDRRLNTPDTKIVRTLDKGEHVDALKAELVRLSRDNQYQYALVSLKDGTRQIVTSYNENDVELPANTERIIARTHIDGSTATNANEQATLRQLGQKHSYTIAVDPLGKPTGPGEVARVNTQKSADSVEQQWAERRAASSSTSTSEPATFTGTKQPKLLGTDLPADHNFTPEQIDAVKAADAEYKRISENKFIGPEFAQLKREEMLVSAGIPVERVAKPTNTTQDKATTNNHAVGRVEEQPRYQAQQVLDRDTNVGLRARTTGSVTGPEAHAAALSYAKHLQEKGIAEIKGEGHPLVIEVPYKNPRGEHENLTIRVVEPDAIPGGALAGMQADNNDIKVWVAKNTPSDQVERAVAGVIQQAIARRTRGDLTDAGHAGELDAMFNRLERASTAEIPDRIQLKPKASEAERREMLGVQIDRSKAERPARIQAEIDLQLNRMGLDLPGKQRDEAVAKLPAHMRDQVTRYLESRDASAIGFNPEALGSTTTVAKPKEGAQKAGSRVLADIKEDVKPYTEADRKKVIELRLVMEQIAECDARLGERDVRGTQQRSDKEKGLRGQEEIAAGESLRRRDLVERQQALLQSLQLGGVDREYYNQRLAELDRLFPGVATHIKPAIETKLNKYQDAQQARAEAKAAHDQQRAHAERVEKELKSAPDPWLGDRLVVGDGIAGMSDIASLGQRKGEDGFVDPTKLLVLGGTDLVARMAASDPSMRWGQRAEVFDPKSGNGGHAIFKDENGNSTGELQRRNEDGGDFVSVGELSDAMDLARQRLGVARVGAKVKKVELIENMPAGSWPKAAEGHPVRVIVEFPDGTTKPLYLKHADLTVGLGQSMVMDKSVLSDAHRQEMFKNQAIVGGEELMTGRDVEKKKILVVGYGPTGGWAAHESVKRGASQVDWLGNGGGAASNGAAIEGLKQVDRVQEAFANEKINISTDRIYKIEPQGKGAKVTLVREVAKGKFELYDVYYDHVVMAIKPDNTGKSPTVNASDGMDNVGTIIEGIKMQPAQNGAPVLESQKGDGRVRVMGGAAADGVTLDKPEMDEMNRRARQVDLTADSPDNRVMEFAGAASEMANASTKKRNDEEFRRSQLESSKEREDAGQQLSSGVDQLRTQFSSELAGRDTTLVGPTDKNAPVLPHKAEDALIGLPSNVVPARATAEQALQLVETKGIPRWEKLSPKERQHEEAFISEVTRPGALSEMVERFTEMSRDENGVLQFEVDAAKKLYSAYGRKKAADETNMDVRATANHALHPAAVLITRIAFLKALDQIAALPKDDPRRNVFVTNGGCAAGKGSLTQIVKDQNDKKFPFGVVWDAAGEGDAQENTWILEAARQRGVKVTYGFVENDPMLTYGSVLSRAAGNDLPEGTKGAVPASGRIVDPITFARSYVRGQENMKEFLASDAYKRAVAMGQADSLGVYTGRYDTKTGSYPDSHKLGDDGKIGSGDIKEAPAEGVVTEAAVKIFADWLQEQRAKGKPVDHWVEGGVVNPLKFDRNTDTDGKTDDGN